MSKAPSVFRNCRPATVRLAWQFLAVIFTLMLCLACSSAPVKSSTLSARTPVETKLRQAARKWAHTPHRLGGLDRRGIDCSGLVKILYDDLFDISLPRTTRLQSRKGRKVASGQWTAGDLIFFRPEDKGSHVGIYLADREFLHATTRKGVIISSLAEPYWRNSYWTARRILSHHPN